jgi:NADH:ubiquinone oxidoreductase subunit 6 (subunit J)
MIYALLTAFTVLFAFLAIRAKRLLSSALWLAVASSLLAVIFYFMGAQLIAVFELSIGAGLVTVLFVFAISIAGEEEGDWRSLVPKSLAFGATLSMSLLLGWFLLPASNAQPQILEPSISDVIWEQRSLDVLLQIAIIFSGVIGLLGLLAEIKAPLDYPVAEQAVVERDRELDALYKHSIDKEAL